MSAPRLSRIRTHTRVRYTYASCIPQREIAAAEWGPLFLSSRLVASSRLLLTIARRRDTPCERTRASMAASSWIWAHHDARGTLLNCCDVARTSGTTERRGCDASLSLQLDASMLRLLPQGGTKKSPRTMRMSTLDQYPSFYPSGGKSSLSQPLRPRDTCRSLHQPTVSAPLLRFSTSHHREAGWRKSRNALKYACLRLV